MSVSTISTEALGRAHGALTEISDLAHFLNSNPRLISRCPPFLPLCFFIGTRFLLALNSVQFQFATDESLDTLTRALGALSVHYHEAGASRYSNYLTIERYQKAIGKLKGRPHDQEAIHLAIHTPPIFDIYNYNSNRH